MPFQPFGYKFDIASPLDPSSVRFAIRSRKTGWMAPKNSARGWIVGSFMCLWWSAFDRHGPMVFGLITHEGQGTRVRGRAGSNLIGVLLFSLLIPLMAFIGLQLISEGSARQLVVIALAILVVGPLIFWLAHKDRRDAEPLVRFLRDAMAISGKAFRERSPITEIHHSLVLDVNGERLVGPLTTESIHDALLNVGPGEFAILSSGLETYLQTAFSDGNYVIEMRQGDSEHHFGADRRKGTSSSGRSASSTFTFEEVREVFLAYATGSPMPHFLNWKTMHLSA